MFRGLSKFTLLRETIVAFAIAAAVYAIGFGALNVVQYVLAEEGDILDCPGRIFGLYCDCPERDLGVYCEEDPSPVDNPNLDCPGRAFGLYCDCPERDLGLYCSEDPSPEENPNENSSGNGGGGNGGGGGGGEEESSSRSSRVLGASTKNMCTRGRDLRSPGYILNRHVPAEVEHIFGEVFGKKITHKESIYWKARVRCDKATEPKVEDTMKFYKSKGQTMPVFAQNQKK